MSRKNVLLLALFLLGLSFTSNGQFGPVCPPNIDFELGNYSVWRFYQGSCCPINTPTASTPPGTYHNLTDVTMGTDPWGGFSVVAPYGGAYSLRLLGAITGALASSAYYDIHVPATSANYSLLYKYAVVLENPTTHTAAEQPRFEVRAIDSVTGIDIPCTIYSFVSSSSLPGFIALGSDRYYKPWTSGSMNLSGLGGSTVTVKFSVGGCSRTGHWGYAYIDMACGIFSITTLACHATTATLQAPPGFNGYTWLDSINMSVTYGTGQTVTILVPTVATTYAVVLTPYSGYGCPDTLYAKMIPSNLVTDKSHDTAICFGNAVTISPHATDILPLNYIWAGPGTIPCTTCDPITVYPPVGVDVYTVVSWDAGGCLKTDSITVTTYPLPVAITSGGSRGAGGVSVNPLTVCVGSTTTLSDAVVGGRWSTSSTTISIGSLSGITSGITAGTASVTYSFPGNLCPMYTTVTVNPVPAPITPNTVCVGLTTTLTDATPGGTWASTTTAVATIGSSGATAGVVTGVAAGTSIITYRLTSTGCQATAVETVNPLPSPIIGATAICTGLCATLSDAGGGTWSTSTSPTLATLTPTGSVGVVCAISPGTAIVTYTLPTSCIATTTIALNVSPAPISGTRAVCIGLTTTLSSAPGGGAWTSSAPGTAAVGGSTGIVTGMSTPTSTTAGTATVSYMLSGCPALATVTVNPLPTGIAGVTALCSGNTTTMVGSPGGGTWSSSSTLIPINSFSGVVTGGVLVGSATPISGTITYTLPTGCIRTSPMTLNPIPAPITGPASLCQGRTTTLVDATAGGLWSTSGTVASVVLGTGVVTGFSPGTQNITYTIPTTGCAAIQTVTVDLTPGIVPGSINLCAGSSATLAATIPGGTWTSTGGSGVAIGGSTGIVTTAPSAFGTATISYTAPSGCAATAPATIFPLPGPIMGSSTVCAGFTTTLTNSIGGAWSSSNTTVATINPSSGVVTGRPGGGTTTITFTAAGGCYATTTFTVTLPPSTMANTTVCSGASVTLTNAVAGGTWSTSSATLAPVVPFGGSSGIVTGGPTASAATATITYSLGGTCRVTAVVTVMPTPVISGPTTVCTGISAVLTSSLPGVTWATSNTTVAAFSSVTGTSATVSGVGTTGTSNITATLPSGCAAAMVFTRTTGPSAILGATNVCIGGPATLSNAGGCSGTWSATGATITSSGCLGIISSVTGPATVSYSLSPGCYITAPITTTPLPSAYMITPPAGNFCLGTPGINIGLSGSSAGVIYQLYNGTTAVGGPVSGTGGAIFFGVQNVAGTYTATGVLNAPPGCSSNMTGSTTITVNPLPVIGGGSALCVGSTMTLTGTPSGGTWISSNAFNVPVGLTSGIVIGGVSGSTAIITYTEPVPTSCQNTKTVTVTLSPTPIAGTANVCPLQSATLTCTPAGGVWSSSTPSIGTIDPGTGVFTAGSTFGTTTITYALGSCIVTRVETVNAPPAAITGTTTACQGVTITLASVSPGGTWTSTTGVPVIITPISAGSATVTSVAGTAGSAIITYALGCVTTTTVNINSAPAAISGSTSLCKGATTTLNNTVIGGTWSTTSPIIGVTPTTPGTAVIEGLLPGTASLTYTIGSGPATCPLVTLVTVNPISDITGPLNFCGGNTTVLNNATAGGTWSTSAPTIAAIASSTSSPASATILGNLPGTSDIIYRMPTGCADTVTVTVNTLPAAITGNLFVCVNETTTLNNATTGGLWGSASGLVTVTTGPGGVGLVRGNAAGVAIVDYSLGFGCTVSRAVTVNPLPSPIAGSGNVCAGAVFTTTVTSTPGGGVWSMSSTGGTGATIGVTSGIISGGPQAGTETVTYTLASTTGCSNTRVITVNPLPPLSTGNASICVGGTSRLSNSGGSTGTWSSSHTLIAPVGATTGLIIGSAPGTARISYTLGGCPSITVVTVSPNPAAIVGASTVCQGQTAVVSSSTPGGVWATGDATIATIVPGSGTTGIITGVSSGTVLMSYTVGNGCRVISSIIVNPSAPILGPNAICPGDTLYLTDSTLTGTWTSSNPARLAATAIGGPSGGVSTGRIVGVVPGIATPVTVTISYTMPAIAPATVGCMVTKTVTVNPLIAAITPASADVCVNNSITLAHAPSTGTWSTSNGSIASVNAFTGVVTGIAPGTAVIGFTMGGCPAFRTVTVNPLPDNIVGGPGVCQGATIILTDPTPGGAWLSSTTTTATVSAGGVVTGITPGTSTIVYTLPTGCSNSTVITVDPIPAPITGVTNVCLGYTTTLATATSATSTINWVSTSPTVASVDPMGVVAGLSPGTATIFAALPSGCYTSIVVTVNSLPAPITGTNYVCEGSSTLLSSLSTGGTWSSDNVSAATVGSTSGLVYGVSAYAGIANITYTLATGCTVNVPFTVNPLPAPITGLPEVCVPFTTVLFNATGTGAWSSATPTLATVDASGVVTGVSPGIASIVYTLATGCAANYDVTVKTAPAAIAGIPNICKGASALFTNSVPGGTWTSSFPSVATVSATGNVTGVNVGNAVISYAVGTAFGCTVSKPVNIMPLPQIFSVSGGGTMCASAPGLNINLNGSVIGTNYFLYNGSAIATGPVAGTGGPINFGLQTVAGIYHVVAVSTYTGCNETMAGTATIVVTPSVIPVVDINLSTGSDTVCTGSSVLYAPNPGLYGGSTPTYKWYVNGTNVSAGGTYTFIPADGDVVSVIMNSSYNCAVPSTATDEVIMHVLPYQTPLVSLSSTPGDTVCQGTAVTMSPNPVYGGGAPTYQWLVNNVIVGLGSTYTYVPVDGDVVYAKMTSNYLCKLTTTVNSNVSVINVDTAAVPYVAITVTPGTSISPDQSATFKATVTNVGDAPTYQWLKNGVPIAGATNATYTGSGFSRPRQDSITCIVTSNGICKISTFAWVYINATGVKVNGPTGMGSDLTVLPNPNKGEFVIKGSLGTTADEEVSLEITNMLGQVVYRNKVIALNGNMEEKVNLGKKLANGMYILSVHTEVDNQVFHIVVEQ